MLNDYMSAGGKSSGNINYQEKSTSGEQNGFFSNIEVYQSANFYCDVTIRGSLILTAPLPIISGGTGRSTVGATGQALVSTGSALTYVDVVKSVTLNTSAIPFLFVNSGTSSTITNTGTFTLNALTTGTGDHVVLQTSPILKTNVGLDDKLPKPSPKSQLRSTVVGSEITVVLLLKFIARPAHTGPDENEGSGKAFI